MTTISFMVSEPEAQRIRLPAQREGVTIPEFLQRGAIRGQNPGSVRKVR